MFLANGMRLSNTELAGIRGLGSWSELDGPKTLNTEMCRTTAVAGQAAGHGRDLHGDGLHEGGLHAGGLHGGRLHGGGCHG